MDSAQLNELISRYLDQTASQQETDLLMQALADPANEMQVKIAFGEQWENWNDLGLLSPVQTENFYASIERKMEQEMRYPVKSGIVKLWKWMAAASIVLAILGVYYFNQTGASKEIVAAPVKKAADVAAPASSHAMITLSNGQEILLDSAGTGALAVQDNVLLTRSADGQIIYSGKTEKISFNTLNNPRGSKVVNITLSDGTKVWLNSESSITYPTAFAGKERKITMTGEAYFEVAKNAAMPFRVSANDAEIMVLGTHFNVNAYADEPVIQTTLLEGSVSVSKGKSKALLAPGQQARLAEDGQLKIIQDADIELALAWKNGITAFKSTDIKTIMRQVQRWYAVDVKYEGNIPERIFTGGISRNVNLSELLRLLEISKIHFRLEANNLTVLP